MSNKFNVFFEEGAENINISRLQHLASLGLDLVGKRVLEVGAGVGRLTGFFEALNCSILSTDGRPENVDVIHSNYPHRQTAIVDLETAKDLSYLGVFDVVFCYGTLYHLQNPEQAFQVLAPICRHLFLLETCVTPGEELEVHPILEDQNNPNQAVSGTGCRPTRPWVMATLKKYFEYSYVSVYQPAHSDFDLNWQDNTEKKLHRAVFVGSRQPLSLETVSASLPNQQMYEPRSYATWIDVGAHEGQSTLGKALHNPALTVYAFEPNLHLANKLTGIASNYTVIPAAVSTQNGIKEFYINQEDAASSLKPFNEAMRQSWVGGECLKVSTVSLVPTVRLDTFLQQQQIQHIDYLKVDAQGGDLDVVKSLGDRLNDCSRIQLEVAVTLEQLYEGAATRQEVLQYMREHKFVLIRATKQSHDQEENLTFVHRNQLMNTPDLADYLETLQADELVHLAEAIAACQPLAITPGWYFDIAFNNPDLPTRARRKIWEYAQTVHPLTIPFQWYSDLWLQLHLGNDLSRQLFISGTYDPNEFYFLSQILKPEMTFLDIGANEGLYSVFAANCVTASGTVLAFEPSQREFDRLTTNIDLNHLINVKSFKIALANANTQQTLKVAEGGHSGQNTLGDFAYEGVACVQTETVEVRQLDDLLAELEIQSVDVIKMDVEGSEFAVLQGAKETIQRCRPLLMLEFVDQALHNQGSSSAEVIAWLRSMGYQLFRWGRHTGRPVPTSEQYVINMNAIAAHPDRLWSMLSEQEQMESLQHELEQTQTELSNAQTELKQTKEDLVAQVYALKQKLETTINELATAEQELSQNKQVKEDVQLALESARNQIAAMESSKIWQIRDRWLNLKRTLGLSATE